MQRNGVIRKKKKNPEMQKLKENPAYQANANIQYIPYDNTQGVLVFIKIEFLKEMCNFCGEIFIQEKKKKKYKKNFMKQE